MMKDLFKKNHDIVEYIKIDMNFNLFRKNIIDDIELYLNEWIDWNMDDDVEKLTSYRDYEKHTRRLYL